MTALTLVMNELSDFNPEEFYNVRAYHCWNKDYNNKQHAPRTSSPTSSESSGVSSMVSSSSLELNMVTPTKSIAILSRIKAKRQLIPVTKKELTESKKVEKLDQDEEESNKIMYRGRNILNLTSNLKPQTWQLTSPLHNSIKANAISIRKSPFQLEDEQIDTSLSVMKCALCDFEEPLPRI